MNKVLTKIKNETGFSNYSMRVICTGIAITTFLTWIAAVGSTGISDVPLEKIDMKLYEQSKADIRAWLDARIKESGDFGVYSFGWSCLQIKGDIANVDLNRGAFADSAAQFFRAFEMLGDRKYLEAGLKTADFFLQVQQPAGHFPTGATIKRGGIATAGGGKHPTHVARMEDGYQFRPFCLLLYAHQLTGEKKYLDSALKHGELISLRMIHPDWGWCPDHFDAKDARPYSQRKTGHDNKGVSGGGSYSDYATSNGFRTAVFMYHLTGDEKYLKRARNLGKWIFATQLGKGKVRGWGKVQMDDSKIVLAMLKKGGREALQKRFRGIVKYDKQQYLEARAAASRRCTDENFMVQLQPLEKGNGAWIAHGHFVMGKYLERVRMRLARPDAKLPKRDTVGRSGLCRQPWKSPLAGYNVVPYGWTQWQFVWDVSLALGKIDADAAARGGLGLESERLAQPWDMMWHWESRCIDVEDWMNVPLAEFKTD